MFPCNLTLGDVILAKEKDVSFNFEAIKDLFFSLKDVDMMRREIISQLNSNFKMTFVF